MTPAMPIVPPWGIVQSALGIRQIAEEARNGQTRVRPRNGVERGIGDVVNIAWRNLARDRARLAISVGGVAFSVLLILLLRGLYAGILDASTSYVRGVDADLWVAQEGTPGDFFHSVSLLTGETRQEIDAVAGVVDSAPLLGRPVVFSHEGRDTDFFLLGVDAETPRAAPATVEDGARVPGDGEIVVDRVFADNLGVGLGDTLDVQGTPLTVSGITRDGNAFVSQFAWASYADAERLLGAEGIVNYFLVRADGDAAEVAARIQDEVAGTKLMTTEEFADASISDLEEGVLPIMWVLVLIGLGVGTVVIGLTIYTATVERRREYGVLKAIGFSNRRLVAVVWQQAIAAGLIGLIAGVALTFAVAALLVRLAPTFVTSIGLADVAFVGIATLVMTLVASLMPIRPVMRLDPADVFRG